MAAPEAQQLLAAPEALRPGEIRQTQPAIRRLTTWAQMPLLGLIPRLAAEVVTVGLALGQMALPEPPAKSFSITHEDAKMSVTSNYQGMERRVEYRREGDSHLAEAERVKMELENHIDICAIRYQGIENQFVGVNARLKRIEAAGWKGLISIVATMVVGMGTILWAILKAAHGGLG